MSAYMTVYMNIDDDSWVAPYFDTVPALLREYGAESVAGGRQVRRIEGMMTPPDRIAVLRFPSMEAIEIFMADPRYQEFKAAREAGSRSEIFVFENLVADGELA